MLRKLYTHSAFVSVSLFVLLLVTFLLSARMILSGDFFYLYDQARDFLLVKNIVLTKDITLIGSQSGIGGFFHGPLYLYLLVPFFLLGKGNPFFYTTFFILIPLLTVLTGFFVGKKLYSAPFGLILAFFLMMSPRIWIFTPSTQGLNLIPLLYLLIVYFVVKFIRGNRKAIIFAVFLAGLTFQFEIATALILLPILVLFYDFFGGARALKDYKTILLCIVAFAVSVGTFILFDLRHNFLMLRSLFSLFGGTPHKGWLSLSERAANHLIGLSGVLTSGFIREHALFLIGAIGLCGYVGYLVLKQKVPYQQLKELLFFISTPLLFFIFYLAYAYPIYSEYVVGLTIPILFAFSLMISLVWSFRPGKAIVVSLFVVSMFFLTTHLLAQYGASYIRDGSAGSYLNQKAAVDWVYADARNEPFGYFVYTPATYTYGMDYLFWYTATSRNQPLPKSEKQAIVYLIMYPPLQHDTQAHEFWKKNTIKTTGKVIAEKSFRGGIVVQKLSLSPDEEPPDSMYYQNLIFR